MVAIHLRKCSWWSPRSIETVCIDYRFPRVVKRALRKRGVAREQFPHHVFVRSILRSRSTREIQSASAVMTNLNSIVRLASSKWGTLSPRIQLPIWQRLRLLRFIFPRLTWRSASFDSCSTSAPANCLETDAGHQAKVIPHMLSWRAFAFGERAEA